MSITITVTGTNPEHVLSLLAALAPGGTGQPVGIPAITSDEKWTGEYQAEPEPDPTPVAVVPEPKPKAKRAPKAAPVEKQPEPVEDQPETPAPVVITNEEPPPPLPAPVPEGDFLTTVSELVREAGAGRISDIKTLLGVFGASNARGIADKDQANFLAQLTKVVRG